MMETDRLAGARAPGDLQASPPVRSRLVACIPDRGYLVAPVRDGEQDLPAAKRE